MASKEKKLNFRTEVPDSFARIDVVERVVKNEAKSSYSSPIKALRSVMWSVWCASLYFSREKPKKFFLKSCGIFVLCNFTLQAISLLTRVRVCTDSHHIFSLLILGVLYCVFSLTNPNLLKHVIDATIEDPANGPFKVKVLSTPSLEVA